MNAPRKTRADDMRVQRYRPPNKLALPTPKNPDIVFRYIRVTLRGSDDQSNWKTKRADGWEPVKASDYPEFMGPSHEEDGSRFAGCIGTGDLVLMQNRRDFIEARTRYYAEQTDAQMAGVDNDLMKEEDARMPIFRERASSTTFNKINPSGSRKVQFDD